MLRIQHLLLLIFGISTSSAYYSCSDDNTDSFTDLINSKDNLEDLLEVAKDASANMSAAIKDWQKEVTDDLQPTLDDIYNKLYDIEDKYSQTYGDCDYFKSFREYALHRRQNAEFRITHLFAIELKERYRQDNNKNIKYIEDLIEKCDDDNDSNECKDKVKNSKKELERIRMFFCTFVNAEQEVINECKKEPDNVQEGIKAVDKNIEDECK